MGVISRLEDGIHCTISIIFKSVRKTYVTFAKQVLLCCAKAQNWRRSNYTLLVLKSHPYVLNSHIGLKNVFETCLPVLF